jgi:hypothetical protein
MRHALRSHVQEISDYREFAVVMGFDALRICLGQKTRKYPPSEVMRWMRLMLTVKGRETR